MQSFATQFRLNSEGGILLLDPRRARQLANDYGDDLTLVLDPEAKTAQSDEERRWRVDNLPSAVRRLESFLSDCGVMVAVVPEGEYVIEVRSGDLNAAERARLVSSAHGWISIESGLLAVSDVLPMFSNQLDLTVADDAVTVPIKNGQYRVALHQLRFDGMAVGVFGRHDTPALIVRADARIAAAREDHDAPLRGGRRVT
jgi:hypothetical protein